MDRRAAYASATARAHRRGRARAELDPGARQAASRSCRPASARRSAGELSRPGARVCSSSRTSERESAQIAEVTESGDALVTLLIRKAQLDGVVDRVETGPQLVEQAKP